MATAQQALGLQTLGLTTLAEVDSLVPVDVFSTQVLEALYEARILSGIVSAVREDLTGEAGNVVQVPFMDRRSAQGPIAPGECLNPVATVTGTYPITLQKFGDYDLIQNEVFEDQEAFSVQDFVNALGEGLAEKADRLLYAALTAAVPGSSIDLDTAGDLADFYAKVVALKAEMRKIPGIRPTHLLVSPDQEAAILTDTDQGIKYDAIAVRDGDVLRVAGLEVIVVPWGNENVGTDEAVQAVIIDQRRAVGEAWGRRPDTVVDRVSKAECDQTKVVTWMRYGVAVLDTDAIGHILNETT